MQGIAEVLCGKEKMMQDFVQDLSGLGETVLNLV